MTRTHPAPPAEAFPGSQALISQGIAVGSTVRVGKEVRLWVVESFFGLDADLPVSGPSAAAGPASAWTSPASSSTSKSDGRARPPEHLGGASYPI